MYQNENRLPYIQIKRKCFSQSVLFKEWFDLFLQEYFCYYKHYNHDISVMKLD